MTSSLGVEVTPGRFRALVTAARSLVEARDVELLETLGSLGDQTGRAPRRSHRDAGPPRRRTAPGRRPPARRAAGAVGRGRTPGVPMHCAAAGRSACSSPTAATRPTPTGPAARPARSPAAANLTEDLHRLVGRGDGEVAWVDGTRRNVRLRLSPIDVGPGAGGDALGRGHRGADQRHHPATRRRARRPRGLPDRGAQRGQPVRLPVPRAALRRPPPARPARARRPRRRYTRSWPGCWRRPAGAPSPSSRAGGPPRRRRDALAPELPYTLLRQGDLPKGRLLEEFAADETSCLFATLGFWQGVDIPGRALSLVTIDRLPFPAPDDPLLQARRGPGRRARLPAGRPAAGGDAAGAGAGRLIRNGRGPRRRGGARPAARHRSYRGVLLSTLPPMRRSVDLSEVESFLRRALEDERGAVACHSAKSKTRLPSRVGGALGRDPHDPAAGHTAQLPTVERVGALVPAHVAHEQPRLGEQPEVARDALPRGVETPGDVVRAQRPGVVVQHGEDPSAGLVGECLEDLVERPGSATSRSEGGSGRPDREGTDAGSGGGHSKP